MATGGITWEAAVPVRCLPRSHTLEAAVLQTSAYSAATVVLLTAEWDEGEAVRCVAVTGEGQVVDLDVTLHGALPMMRGHSMTHCGDGVFVTYGGSGQDGLIEVAHRLEVLEVADSGVCISCSELECLNSPAARGSHTSTALADGRILVFGGVSRSVAMNDVHVLTPGEGGGDCLTAAVFGGHNGSTFLNDVQVLDLERNEWREMATEGAIPHERAHHAAVLVAESFLCVHGGQNITGTLEDCYVLDLENERWIQCYSDVALQAMSKHSLLILSSGDGECVAAAFGSSGPEDGEFTLTQRWLRATSDEVAGDRPVMLSVGGSNADESCESLKEMVCDLVWANRRLNQLLSRQTLHCCDLSAKLAEVTYNYALLNGSQEAENSATQSERALEQMQDLVEALRRQVTEKSIKSKSKIQRKKRRDRLSDESDEHPFGTKDANLRRESRRATVASGPTPVVVRPVPEPAAMAVPVLPDPSSSPPPSTTPPSASPPPAAATSLTSPRGPVARTMRIHSADSAEGKPPAKRDNAWRASFAPNREKEGDASLLRLGARTTGRTSDTPLYHCGYMYKLKRGRAISGWKKRWFKLENLTLSYYSTPRDTKAKGTMDMNLVILQPRIEKAERPYMFGLVEKTYVEHEHEESDRGRSYLFACENYKDMRDWIRMLQAAKKRSYRMLTDDGEDEDDVLRLVRDYQAQVSSRLRQEDLEELQKEVLAADAQAAKSNSESSNDVVQLEMPTDMPPPPPLVEGESGGAKGEEATGEKAAADEVAPAQHASGAGEKGEGEGGAAAVDTAGQAERDKHQLHRSRVLSELIETERDYVKDMRTVVEVYKGRMEAVQWISASDIEKIFINIPEIVQFSTALLSELDAIKRRDVEEQGFGETFLNFALAGEFDLYIIFCESQHISDLTIRELSSQPRFSELLEEARQHPDCKRLDLQSFLIKPFQRICKYPLLLRELLGCTPQVHPDHVHLTASMDALNRVLEAANEAKRLSDRTRDLMSLDEKLIWTADMDAGSMSKVGRQLMRRGNFAKIVHHGERYKGHCILLNDMLLVTKEPAKNGTMQVRCVMPIKCCLVWPMQAAKRMYPFSVMSSSDAAEKIELYAGSEAEMEAWMNDITDAIIKDAKLVVPPTSRLPFKKPTASTPGHSVGRQSS